MNCLKIACCFIPFYRYNWHLHKYLFVLSVSIHPSPNTHLQGQTVGGIAPELSLLSQ